MRPIVRPVNPQDAEALAWIYNYYVAETVVTFEEEPVNSDEMIQRIHNLETASLPWLVAELDTAVVGYAYASRWKPRSAYRYSTETTVYVAPDSEAVASARRSIPTCCLCSPAGASMP